jgi:hypothetical protein
MAEKLELEAATRINPRTGERLLTIDTYVEMAESFSALRRVIDNAFELESENELEVEDKVQALFSQLIHEEIESRKFGMMRLRQLLQGKKGSYQILANNIEQIIDTEKYPRESFSVPYKGYDRRGNSLIAVTSQALGAPVSVIEFFKPDMHVRLQDAHRKRMAMQNQLSILARAHALKYGMIENGNLYEINESGNVKTNKSRGIMTTQDKVWVEDLFSIPTALRESSKLLGDVFQNKKLSKEAKIKRLVKIIESQADFEKEGRRPLSIVHGRTFIDEAGNEVPAVEPIRDLYNRWIAEGNVTL